MSAPKLDPKKTTMVFLDAVIVEEGENKGALAISVEATRNKKKYRIPYLIAPHNVASFDFDVFKHKVRDDVTAREQDANQAQLIVDKIKGMSTAPIELD